ncbi:MAG: hypothetical protein ACXIT4_13260 [Erythrobacter sp.]
MAAPLADPAEAQSEKPRLDCKAGAIERYFGGIQWLVLACDDGASLVVVTGPQSPETLSFFFIIFPKDGVYQLAGEGNGDKALTRPAHEALTAMTPDEIRALHAEASAARPPTPSMHAQKTPSGL